MLIFRNTTPVNYMFQIEKSMTPTASIYHNCTLMINYTYLFHKPNIQTTKRDLSLKTEPTKHHIKTKNVNIYVKTIPKCRKVFKKPNYRE